MLLQTAGRKTTLFIPLSSSFPIVSFPTERLTSCRLSETSEEEILYRAKSPPSHTYIVSFPDESQLRSFFTKLTSRDIQDFFSPRGDDGRLMRARPPALPLSLRLGILNLTRRITARPALFIARRTRTDLGNIEDSPDVEINI